MRDPPQMKSYRWHSSRFGNWHFTSGSSSSWIIATWTKRIFLLLFALRSDDWTPAKDICATLSFCLPQFWTSFLAAFCFQPLQWKYSFSDSQSASIREIHNLLDVYLSCFDLLIFCFWALFQSWIFSFSWILKNPSWVFPVFWPSFYSPTFSFYFSASFFPLFLNCVCQGALLVSLFFLSCQHWFPLACCEPGHSSTICKFENCIFWEST